MKNQNDLIFSIVFGVLGLVAAGIAYGTKPEPPTIPPPPTINVADAPLPTTAVVYGNALPGGTANAGAQGGPGGFPGGAPGGFPGAPGGGRFPGGPPGGLPGGPPPGFAGPPGRR